MSDGGVPSPVPPGAAQAELYQLDRALAASAERTGELMRQWQAAYAELDAIRARRDQLAGWLLSQPPPVAPPTQPAAPTGPVPAPAGAGKVRETSTGTVQTVLFVLGAMLLGVAAITFTAVAWATFGLAGRAAILAAVTVLVLLVPMVALWRRLRATAETFAQVGLLLVLLDGYAAWTVNLIGPDTVSPARYAALVFALSAAIALGYRVATGLSGPLLTALVIAQPVPALLATDLSPGIAGWSMVASATATMNLAVCLRSAGTWDRVAARAGGRAGRPLAALAALAGLFLAAGLLVAGAIAVLAELLPDTPATAGSAGLALVLVGGVAAGIGGALGPLVSMLSTGTLTSIVAPLRIIAGAGAVLTVTIAGSRFVAVAWPDRGLLLVSTVVAAVAVAARTGRRLLPVSIRSGPAIAAVIGAGMLAAVLAGEAFATAVRTVADTGPAWRAVLVHQRAADWQPLAGIGLAALALAVVLPAAARRVALATAIVLAVLALPGAVPLSWWVPSIVDIVAAAALAVLAALPARGRFAPAAVTCALGGAVLTVHAVLASLARPANTAVVLGAVAVVGLGTGGLTRLRPAAPASAQPERGRPAGQPDPGQAAGSRLRVVGGCGVLIGLAALPPAVGAAVAAAEPGWSTGPARAALAAVLTVLVGQIVVRRRLNPLARYAFAATLFSAVLWSLVIAALGVDPAGGCAGVGLVLVAAALLVAVPSISANRPGTPIGAALAASPLVLVIAADALPAVLAVVGLPFGWLGTIWSGAPAGVGLGPGAAPAGSMVGWADAAALALLALASAVASYAVRRRLGAALAGLSVGGPTAILVGLTAAGSRWPTVPAATLGLGLLITAAVALRPVGAWRTASGLGQGPLYLAAGLAGCLSVDWATLAGLGSIVVGAVVVGARGRGTGWRVAGWCVAVSAGLATAATAGIAANLAVRDAAYGVLAAAAVALAGGAALRRHRPTEATVIETAAQAGAALALLFTLGWIGHAALVSAVWGTVLAVRAVLPATGRAARAGFAAAAAGCQVLAWWLLLADRGVTLVEAYTLPLAGVTLLAGIAALRARADLHSWVCYGPALAAAFLPSLGYVLTTVDPTGFPVRRLLLGGGALATVLVGSVRRRQAPVVVGGLVLAVVAAHELVVVSTRLPTWIPLAAGGVVLVALAITYERRRRDLARLRGALGRMR
jgi:hypothetical protein